MRGPETGFVRCELSIMHLPHAPLGAEQVARLAEEEGHAEMVSDKRRPIPVDERFDAVICTIEFMPVKGLDRHSIKYFWNSAGITYSSPVNHFFPTVR